MLSGQRAELSLAISLPAIQTRVLEADALRPVQKETPLTMRKTVPKAGER